MTELHLRGGERRRRARGRQRGRATTPFRVASQYIASGVYNFFDFQGFRRVWVANCEALPDLPSRQKKSSSSSSRRTKKLLGGLECVLFWDVKGQETKVGLCSAADHVHASLVQNTTQDATSVLTSSPFSFLDYFFGRGSRVLSF